MPAWQPAVTELPGGQPSAASSGAGLAYDAYARLVRMLLPSSRALSIYSSAGEQTWSTDPVERPESRALVQRLARDSAELPPNCGQVFPVTNETSALVALIAEEAGARLGFVVIELDGPESGAVASMASSLTRPLLACMRYELGSSAPLAVAAAAASPPAVSGRLDFMLSISKHGPGFAGRHTFRMMLEACVEHLNCLSAVLWLPAQDLLEVVDAPALTDSDARQRIAGTRKHLLAWAKANQRPMVVNRIDSSVEQYKILSCPVSGADGAPTGLLAVFRMANASNFELDDVRVVEFLAHRLATLTDETPPPDGA